MPTFNVTCETGASLEAHIDGKPSHRKQHLISANVGH